MIHDTLHRFAPYQVTANSTVVHHKVLRPLAERHCFPVCSQQSKMRLISVSGDHLRCVQSKANPLTNQARPDAGQSGKLRRDNDLTLVSNKGVLSCIGCLLMWCRPAAVVRLIVSIVVRVAVYRMPRGRPRPHVSVKVLKRLPSLAYADSPATVVAESLCCLAASPNHPKPDCVFRRCGQAVRCCGAPAHPTSLRCSSPKFGGTHRPLMPALASAHCPGVMPLTRAFSRNNKVAKRLPNKRRYGLRRDHFFTLASCGYTSMAVVPMDTYPISR